jgi:hypothetical protein
MAPTRGGKEREVLGLGVGSGQGKREGRGSPREREKDGPSVAHAGEKKGKERAGLGQGVLGCPFSFLSFPSFLFLFHTQTIQTILFEFK